jgi:dipeptidyl aminopeptidase/acylaminoacyl peptidase
MIVYTYEILTPRIHRYENPSERSCYNTTAWTQEGYFVLLPDIVYRAREPGVSAIEAVRPAVAKVVELGLVDAERVGLIGHSWGGYQAAYLATRTKIFAASVAGAPLTDFVSFMGQIHWSNGLPEPAHWETGQGRMEVPYWEDPQAHLRNSPLEAVHEMTTPVLLAHGNADMVIEFFQSTVFYNYARRAGKQLVLLVYEGENHSFREEANQIDYHRRILEWFGHYLKGEPAPDWITNGIPFKDLEDEKRRVAEKGVEATDETEDDDADRSDGSDQEETDDGG